MNSSPIDYDLLFAGTAIERKWLSAEQVARAQMTQQKLRQLQIFHSLGKICLEFHLLTREQTLSIQEDIQKTCKLTEKPLLNIFVFPKDLADHFWEKMQHIPLLSTLQIQRCLYLQNTLRALEIERHPAEIALEEKLILPEQLQPFASKTISSVKILNSSLDINSSLTPPTLGPTESTHPEIAKKDFSKISETSHEKALLESLAKEIRPAPPSSEFLPLTPSPSPSPSLSSSSGAEHPIQLEDYEILHEISQGGMGIIYKARQKRLDRIVALKLLKGGEQAPSSLIERFNLEAKALAKLSHPNILPIYDSGSFQKCPYFVMEYVDGHSLKELLKIQRLPLSEILHIIRSVAKALQHAHEKGFCHRDIKPANMMIDRSNRVFLMDFGLVKNFNHDLNLTNPGALMGTPAYMSPEQIDAKKFGKVGIQSDIYSLGAVLYEMLTGVRPFSDMAVPGANTVGLAMLIISEELKPPSHYRNDIPLGLEKICMKCLQKKQEDRYASVAEFLQHLETWLRENISTTQPQHSSILSKPPSSIDTASSSSATKKVAPVVFMKSSTPSSKSTSSSILSGSVSEEALFRSPIRSAFPKIPDFIFKKKLEQELLGDLFVANQQSLDRYVFIRIVPRKIYIVSQAQTNPLFQNYFEQSQRLSRIYHPQLLPFLDIDSTGENFYFIRPFVRGRTLAQTLKEKEKLLSFYRKIEIFVGLASALETLARENLVYYDIVPENILLGSEGEIKLFESCLGRSRTAFMSPEEAAHRPLSPKADQFSLGLVMFLLFCEYPLIPLEWSEKQTLEYLQNYQNLPAKDRLLGLQGMAQSKVVSTRMMTLLERCLKEKPEERFEDLTLLIEQLERIKILLLEETVKKMPVQTRLMQGIPVTSIILWKQFFLSLLFCLTLLAIGIYPYFDPIRSRAFYQALKQFFLQYFLSFK